ncbi:EAL domain-containing response regulator [Calothrix sp. PCC 6303]|uniref:two-component system response regulator n=1 Tax=Calothrix sp. PCC 6303 TaxID=1170562 RepID=UPI0002A046AF|nr:EAL domain-containing response regulator [Calothrix sp. PCC 6303]AFZ04414.1 response regulator receiver modulated diguanylate phosphodiesterase [Calothrix sp. PCC 6303]
MNKILVIEDELAVRENLVELLEAEGFETIAAPNGHIGIQKAMAETPDLILCDMMMPEVDGYGVLTNLREEPSTATIPFIFLTAKSAKSDFRQGMDLGADDYITKPFTRAELLSAIMGRLSKQSLLKKYLSAKADTKVLSPEIQYIEISLSNALSSPESDVFPIRYKPIVDIQSHQIIALESFLYWQSQDLGLVSPPELIPLAELTNLVASLGKRSIEAVCEQQQIWQQSGYINVPVSVNISAGFFNQPDFVQIVSQVLNEYNLSASDLQLEITENIIMQDINSAIFTINELRSLGIKIAVDDFGTGNSSLIYLKQLPVHILKIDPYFIHNIANDSQKSAITTALIQMGQNLKLQIIAQGVDSTSELVFAAKNNCDAVQGSLFNQALSPVELEQVIFKGYGNIDA